jgi:uncharacterized protein YbaA (DUF1428 family)
MSEFDDQGYDALFDSEYENSLVLAGLDSIEEQEELLGRIMRNPRQKRNLARKVFSSQTKVVGGKTNSREDFQRRFKQLPTGTRKSLLNRQKQLVDTALYVVKEVSNNRIVKMLQDNVSGGKLEKGNFFTLKGIQLLYGVAGEGEDSAHVNFGVIPDFIRNGEFEFVANGSILIPSMSMEVFNTKDMSHRMGYFELVNPKMIETQQPMDFEIEWGVNAPAKSYVKAILHGTSVAKY